MNSYPVNDTDRGDQCPFLLAIKSFINRGISIKEKHIPLTR